MTDYEGFHIIYSVMLLVLVGSALISYRLPLKQTVKMALVWVLIFAIGVAVVYGIENVFNLGAGSEAPASEDGSQGGAYV